jgi:hypothetical protein
MGSSWKAAQLVASRILLNSKELVSSNDTNNASDANVLNIFMWNVYLALQTIQITLSKPFCSQYEHWANMQKIYFNFRTQQILQMPFFGSEQATVQVILL